mmetsp:Transcript_30437/g.69454  ORF Transcript_30437/g.69454 Transcript_30437/m.69454 type:complete len:213 (+) Transcript_30437:1571-2209(+)
MIRREGSTSRRCELIVSRGQQILISSQQRRRLINNCVDQTDVTDAAKARPSDGRYDLMSFTHSRSGITAPACPKETLEMCPIERARQMIIVFPDIQNLDDGIGRPDLLILLELLSGEAPQGAALRALSKVHPALIIGGDGNRRRSRGRQQHRYDRTTHPDRGARTATSPSQHGHSSSQSSYSQELRSMPSSVRGAGAVRWVALLCWPAVDPD